MCPILAANRILLVKLNLGPQHWPTVLPMVESVLNWDFLERLGSRPDRTPRAPLEVMIGVLPPHPITLVFPPYAAASAQVTISEARAMQLLHITEMKTALDNMHHAVADTETQRRKVAVEKHNRGTNFVRPSFTRGDHVLVHHVVDRVY